MNNSFDSNEELDELVAFFLGLPDPPALLRMAHATPQEPILMYGDGFLDLWVDTLPSQSLIDANEILDFEFDPSLKPYSAVLYTGTGYQYTLGRGVCSYGRVDG